MSTNIFARPIWTPSTFTAESKTDLTPLTEVAERELILTSIESVRAFREQLIRWYGSNVINVFLPTSPMSKISQEHESLILKNFLDNKAGKVFIDRMRRMMQISVGHILEALNETDSPILLKDRASLEGNIGLQQAENVAASMRIVRRLLDENFRTTNLLLAIESSTEKTSGQDLRAFDDIAAKSAMEDDETLATLMALETAFSRVPLNNTPKPHLVTQAGRLALRDRTPESVIITELD